ncbi:hypothetical protein [Parasitella parasitica]|uniref:Uncharacterized protein n=1 Tax=Parasitella parasitica TaxID=35722 RepID=A0A0B7NGK7_9FUNG|nr:hypothetical protein [Parasitella parasitica]
MQYQNNYQQDFDFISKLPTLKTSNLIDFVNAAAQTLIDYQRISANSNNDNWLIKLDFKSYVTKQKATHEIAKRFFQESNKCNKDSFIVEKKQTSTTDKRIPPPPKDKNYCLRECLIWHLNEREAVKKLSKDSKGT